MVTGIADSRITRGGSKIGFWHVKCDCGREKQLSTANIRDGKVATCGHPACSYRRSIRLALYGEPSLTPYRNALRLYRHRCLKRGMQFMLTMDQFHDLYLGRCIYCGKMEARGIDRIDSALGYKEGNCASCCKVCNSMKGTLPVEEFKKQVSIIASRTALF